MARAGLAAAVALLAGCEVPPGGLAPSGGAVAATPAAAAPTSRVDPTLAPAPQQFAATARARWDGALTLQGVWIAHPQAKTARRVRITNLETGTAVDGAMFRRDDSLAGPAVLISSDLAKALGIPPGVDTELSLVALTPAAPQALAKVDTDGLTTTPLAAPTGALTGAGADGGLAGATVAARDADADDAAGGAAAPVAGGGAPAPLATAPRDPATEAPLVSPAPAVAAAVAEASPPRAPVPGPVSASPVVKPPAPLAEDVTDGPDDTGPVAAADPAAAQGAAAPPKAPDAAAPLAATEAAAAASAATAAAPERAVPRAAAAVAPPKIATAPAPQAAAVPDDPAPGDQPITDGRRYIQAGSFGVAANGTKLADALVAAGLTARARTGGGVPPITRVVVGPFDTRAARDAALAKIRGLGLKDASPVKG